MDNLEYYDQEYVTDPILVQQLGKPDILLHPKSPMQVVNEYHKEKWEKMEKDAVNSPAHYNTGGIECIDYLKDNMSWEGYTGYLEGNTKKYLHRWRYKSKPVEDLKKARWYLDRLITELEGDPA
jgi:hypothetical protein